MSVPATPETPPAEETPIVENPIVETPSESPAPETPVEPTAPDVEAKGILERIAAAFRGDETVKAELANARAAIASRDAEVAALKAEVQTLKPQAEQLAAITAKLTEAEAKAKTVGQAAAEIAATHGLKPDALGSLPAPSEEGGEDIVAQFNAITDAGERTAFYNKHKAALRKTLFNK